MALLWLILLLSFFDYVLSDYGITYYVSTTGSDSNPGNISSPFKTLNHARDVIRNNSLPDGGILVYIRGGTYYNSNYSQYNVPLLDLSNPNDSGKPGKPIIWSSYPNEKVEIFGGYQINSKAFIPSIQYPDLLVANLSKLNNAHLWNIVNFGSIGTGNPYNGSERCNNSRSELFVNKKRMILARWPNIYYDEEQYPNIDFWNFTNIVNVTNNITNFIYNFSNKRAAQWSKEIDVWLHGYWGEDWADSYTKIKSIDTTKNIINTYSNTPPMYGYHNNARYYGVNILSELDTINEYYLDKKNKLIYISSLRLNTLSTDKYYINVNPILIKVSNIQFISIENITIGYGIKGGLYATNISNCSFNNFIIFGIGETGMTVNGYNNTIINNNITGIGCGGMDIDGGDIYSLTKGNNLISSNFIKYYAEWHRTYVPGISFSGVSNLYINNYVGYAPHSGFIGGSVDSVFERNTFERLCYEVRDSAGWYSGRSWIHRGNLINNNTFINIRTLIKTELGWPYVNGVYLDDQISGNNVTNNIFINCQTGIKVGGGRRNEVHGNKFASNDISVAYDDRGLVWQTSFCPPGGLFNEQLNSVNYTNPPWSIHFPYLPNIYNQQPCVPVFDHITNNEFCCGMSKNCIFINIADNMGSYYKWDYPISQCQVWNSTCVDNTNTSWSNDYC